jgi:predicted Fe-Mo cluster-binding NifX family protein
MNQAADISVQNKESIMKIALITDDGKTISQHFGRAPYYLVCTIEEGKVTGREMREKMGHTHFSNQEHAEQPGNQHGMDAAAHGKHTQMADVISDCQVVICRLNIQPVVTDLRDIEKVIDAYISGQLADHTELLH